jgi:hypothetical protein
MDGQTPTDAGHVTGDLSSHRAFAPIPMPSTIPAIWAGLALLALAAVALVPACEYLNRRYVAADPWKAT